MRVTVSCLSHGGEGSFTERDRKDKERDLMDVTTSAHRLPTERLLVAMETAGEEIKKGRE